MKFISFLLWMLLLRPSLCFFSLPPPCGTATKTLLKHLQEDLVSEWGFVIIRATYKSQDKWDAYLSLLKNDTHHRILSRDLVDTWKWTIIEDPTALEGANHTSAMWWFNDWVMTEGRRELDHSPYPGSAWINLDPVWQFTEWLQPEVGPKPKCNWKGCNAPRYNFFIFADEDMLERTMKVEEAAARGELEKKESEPYFFKLVSSFYVFWGEKLARKRARERVQAEVREGRGKWGKLDVKAIRSAALREMRSSDPNCDYHQGERKWFKDQNILQAYEYLLEGWKWVQVVSEDFMQNRGCRR